MEGGEDVYEDFANDMRTRLEKYLAEFRAGEF
jgi:hypothetical protein